MSTGPTDLGHRGQTTGGLEQKADPQTAKTAKQVNELDPTSNVTTSVGDVYRAMHDAIQRFAYNNPLQIGHVVQAIPYLNWYKVQVGLSDTFIGCRAMTDASLLPMGVRSTGVVPPNSSVLVFRPPGDPTVGIIIGVVPMDIAHGKHLKPDWVQQGSNCGFYRDKAHTYALQNLYREGGIRDHSHHRPSDMECWEWGRFSETGVGFMVDMFQTLIRVNECCGLFLNYFDSYTRLAGLNMDIQTMPWNVKLRDDEGECQIIAGQAAYPWEAMGLYKEGEEWTKEYPPDPVMTKLPYARVDVIEGNEDMHPFYRVCDYGGYLGQGIQRFVAAPPQDFGIRYFKNEDKDRGLFHEHIALTGAYTMRSAKSVVIAKRVMIPVPKRMKLAEDQKSGDDAEKDNYKFSSQYGSGAEHKIKDVQVTGTEKHILKVVGVQDLLAYHYNWSGLHPFHYHENDYKLWEESECEPFDSAQDNLNFGELENQEFMSYPDPKQIKIDHRYGDVDYFQREAFFVIHDDGGVQLGCGYGAQLLMSGGTLQMDCPGGIKMLPGKNFVVMSRDIILRANNSVDVSANEGECRFKSEKNMQFLAANGGEGGMLFDCRSEGGAQIYKDLYGEDVIASGIVMLAPKSEVGALAKDIYLRTGATGDEEDRGDITIDASKGFKAVNLYGQKINAFVYDAIDVWHQPQDEEANIIQSHRFSRYSSIIGGQVIMEKDVTIYDGNLSVGNSILVNNSIIAANNIIAGEKLSQKDSIFVGPHDGLDTDFETVFETAEQSHQGHKEAGEGAFNGYIVARWYSQNMLGNEDTVEPMGFSYRDPPGSPGSQYKVDGFKMIEPRWQQMVRLGTGTGGIPWQENPVIYQGEQLFPWPGRAKWQEEDSYWYYKENTMYDASAGHSKDRGEDYEDPKLGEWGQKTLEGEFLTII